MIDNAKYWFNITNINPLDFQKKVVTLVIDYFVFYMMIVVFYKNMFLDKNIELFKRIIYFMPIFCIFAIIPLYVGVDYKRYTDFGFIQQFILLIYFTYTKNEFEDHIFQVFNYDSMYIVIGILCLELIFNMPHLNCWYNGYVSRFVDCFTEMYKLIYDKILYLNLN